MIIKPQPKPTTSRSLLGKPPSKGTPKDAVKMELSEVPERAVLARNILGSSGTLLLAAGTPFRARIDMWLSPKAGRA